MTVGANCVVVAVGKSPLAPLCQGGNAMLTGDVAIDGSDFVDESELFKQFHGSINGGDIDGVVTDFCNVVGVEWFG